MVHRMYIEVNIAVPWILRALYGHVCLLFGGFFFFPSEFAALQAHQQHLENRYTCKPLCIGGEGVSAGGNTEDC